MRSSVAVRLAAPGDLDRVHAIELEAFSDPWRRESFGSLIGDRRVFFAVAAGADAPAIGYVVAWFVVDDGEIANLAVASDARGLGVGGALLGAAITAARDREVAAIYLEVRESNDVAQRLYRSHGFEKVGRRKSYYRRPAEDALVLRFWVN
ncbi:MAG: ribosomal protein S18-alanine N-acetyltransferase [Gemmatimonadaceae bacterium]